MKTIDIKGKAYVTVAERIKAFRASHQGYRLITEMLSCDDRECIFKASVINSEGVVVSTGHAYEKENSSYINKTSYIENCETSAIGRALGTFGIGIDSDIATADEVINSKLQQLDGDSKEQSQVKMSTKEQHKIIADAITDGIINTKNFKQYMKEQFNKSVVGELTFDEASKLVKMICVRRAKLES